MTVRETIFLTREQALEAVCIDFRRYEPQVMLFSEVLRVISKGKAVIEQGGEKKGRWVAAQPGTKMVWLSGPALGDYVCRALRAEEHALGVIASVCARVFQTRAFPGTDPESGQTGIYIATGMEDFTCIQCGDCCRFLDYHEALSPADVRMWEQMARQDILERVGASRRPDGGTAYRIWIEPDSGKLARVCPFLQQLPDENRWICSIHDVKPRICREYPVSRKHGLMTGCPGFSRK